MLVYFVFDTYRKNVKEKRLQNRKTLLKSTLPFCFLLGFRFVFYCGGHCKSFHSLGFYGELNSKMSIFFLFSFNSFYSFSVSGLCAKCPFQLLIVGGDSVHLSDIWFCGDLSWVDFKIILDVAYPYTYTFTIFILEQSSTTSTRDLVQKFQATLAYKMDLLFTIRSQLLIFKEFSSSFVFFFHWKKF